MVYILVIQSQNLIIARLKHALRFWHFMVIFKYIELKTLKKIISE